MSVIPAITTQPTATTGLRRCPITLALYRTPENLRGRR